MLNHGLVVVPLFLIIGVIALRSGGSESVTRLGGMAFRAPVLAALFLLVTFATLAMPGSSNFVGELLVLFGTFEDKLVYGLVASVGVVLAGVYMIRVFQRTMHNREGPAVESREIGRIDLAAIAPLVAVIVALGVYPDFVVNRTEAATVRKIEPARAFAAEQQAREDAPRRGSLATLSDRSRP
jgi:NADH-quinone oxidoreductase subunit M